ncbi:MAG: PIN domain-containing protein [Acidobacteria bacterium]|nr:PIN domain-containing protein [Acidobacteriota bacterium]
MSACVADTHALIWYVLNDPRLSPAAQSAMQSAAAAGDSVFVPSISLVEIIYLIEKGRFPQALLQRIVGVLDDPLRELKSVLLDENVAQAVQQIPRQIVPDMPDRIVAATALHLNLPLIAADHQIRAAGIQTIW